VNAVVSRAPAGFVPLPNNHPVSYRTRRDAMGRFWIECHCRVCGELYRKQCQRPQLWQQRVFQYATLHGHGLRPRIR
jgi:hypothetical protein